MSRRLRLTISCVTILLAITAIARSADDKPADKDLEQLQGEWQMQTGSTDGMPIPEEMRPHFKRICKGDELSVLNGEQLIMKAKIKLDSSKTPREIDYDVTEGPNKGKKLLGIYELDGDTFKSSFAAPDAPRPTDFTSKAGDKKTVSMWKRAKKE